MKLYFPTEDGIFPGEVPDGAVQMDVGCSDSSGTIVHINWQTKMYRRSGWTGCLPIPENHFRARDVKLDRSSHECQ